MEVTAGGTSTALEEPDSPGARSCSILTIEAAEAAEAVVLVAILLALELESEDSAPTAPTDVFLRTEHHNLITSPLNKQ